MNKIFAAAAAFALSATVGHAATLTGDTINVEIANGGTSVDDTVVVGAGIDAVFGATDIDVDVNTGPDDNGLLIAITPGVSFCGIILCDGGTASFTFSDLDFSGGEELVDFIVDEAVSNFLGFTIVSPTEIVFDFLDDTITAPNGVQLSGTFVTQPMGAIPLPAGAPLLLAGLGAFAVMRRRKSK